MLRDNTYNSDTPSGSATFGEANISKEIDVMDVERYLSTNVEFVKSWVMKNIGRSMLEAWVSEKQISMQATEVIPNASGKSGKGSRKSGFSQGEDSTGVATTTDLFENFLKGTHKRSAVQRKTRNELMKMSQKDVFMELIRDIANELDVNVLCHKILMNVCVLLNADRGSLFLARGVKENKYLVSKLFDVTEHSHIEDCLHTEENHITVKFGKGIAGTVALTKQAINIKDAYSDTRFNKEVDKSTGFVTKNILTMPILDYEGEVLGVATVVNKLSDEELGFVSDDEQIFRDYLTFAGIGLTNAQMFEMSVGEVKQNQLLLMLAKGIFAEQSNLDKLVQHIMLDAQDLIQCERCSVYLVKVSNVREVDFIKSFQMSANNPDNIIKPSPTELMKAQSAFFARNVAQTGQVVIIVDTVADPKYLREIIDYDGFRIKSLLCVPITDGQHQIIGVVQMMNKSNGKPFTNTDISSVETFAIFCGLGIHNCQLHEKVEKLGARHKITSEVLAYHATASLHDTAPLLNATLGSADNYRLYSFDFTDLSFDNNVTCEIVLKMFMEINALETFEINMETLCRWIITVKKNYRPCFYHNWRHAVSVTQSMFSIFFTGKMARLLDELEMFALLVACLGLNIDYMGQSNSTLLKRQSPLTTLYNASYMEHHHFDRLMMVIETENCNILAHLSVEDYTRAVNIIERAIISTDNLVFLKQKKDFIDVLTSGERNWQDLINRSLLRSMLMKAAEACVVYKPWPLQARLEQWVMCGTNFGDPSSKPKEEDLNDYLLSPKHKDFAAQLAEHVSNINERTDEELIKLHIDYVETVCLPLYQLMAKLDLAMAPLLNNVTKNLANWKALTEQALARGHAARDVKKHTWSYLENLLHSRGGTRHKVNKNELARALEDDDTIDLMAFDDRHVAGESIEDFEYHITSSLPYSDKIYNVDGRSACSVQ